MGREIIGSKLPPWPRWNEEAWPGGDPRWALRAKPLLTYLATERTLKEIDTWGRTLKTPAHMSHQLLCWVENRELVTARCVQGIWKWRRINERPQTST